MARSLEVMYHDALFLFLQWIIFAGGCVFLLLVAAAMFAMTEKVTQASTRYAIERHGIRLIKVGPKYSAQVWIPWRATWLALRLILVNKIRSKL